MVGRLVEVVLEGNADAIRLTDIVLTNTLQDLLPLGGDLIEGLLRAQLASKRLGGASCHRTGELEDTRDTKREHAVGALLFHIQQSLGVFLGDLLVPALTLHIDAGTKSDFLNGFTPKRPMAMSAWWLASFEKKQR